MKKLTLLAFMALFSTTAMATETKDFDGCLAIKVEGANYYNFVDPLCKTQSEIYSSSPAEDKRAEAVKED